MSEEKKQPPPKLQLRRGLRPTNLTIHRDGRTLTERVEPGRFYSGEEYHPWVPRILVPVDPTVKVESLRVPEPPPHRRGVRRMRRVLSPQEKPVGVKTKAVLTKRTVTEAEKKPAPPAPRRPPTADAHPESAPDAAENQRQKIRGTQARLASMTKKEIVALAKKEGFEVNAKDRVDDLRKAVKKLLADKLKKLR